jgi:signal transduction histidine kinase
MRDRSVEDHIQSQKKMLVQVDRLTSIVDALLRSARHESGVVPDVNLLESVQAICAVWAEEYEIGSEQLKVDGVALHSQIDEEELSVVLSNLLENARRHTPSGTAITVNVGVDGRFAKITVSDNGPGIEASHRSQVFERFYRPEQSRNSRLGGAGIGLAIVRRIAEMRGGSVQMDDVEIGTSVSVRLPISA